MKFRTKAIHAGQDPEPAFGATTFPIYQTSTYTQEELGKHKGYTYTRTHNPTRTALEQCVASLEEGEFGIAFASGLAATMGVLSLLSQGDHILACDDLYGGTYRLFTQVMERYGLSCAYADATDLKTFQSALRPETEMIWIETPSNPLLKVADIAAIATLARSRAVLLAVDSTLATPYLQRPLAVGAHICMHSTTKYLNGHMDSVGGMVVVNEQRLHDAIRFHQNAMGGTPGPFDSWLTLRGLKTLAMRMGAHSHSALAVAQMLTGHQKVAQVRYPGLKSHPNHEVATRQMSLFGGIVTFELKGGLEGAKKFMSSIRVFSLAEDLGGVRSLACHPATMTHSDIPEEKRRAAGLTDGLVRLSVGIEDTQDQLDDLEQALGQV